nr:hypothetical protein [uncultured Oribacterium sp.]
MRRKNMLALGISVVLGVGASSTLAYALPLEQEESLQTSASEVGNTGETASNTATVAEEDAEKDTAEDSSAVEEMEASDKEKEEAEEESSLSTEALGGTDRAAEETLTPLSRSRRALADTPHYANEEEEKADRKNRILSVTAEIDTADVAARDHMKVIRNKDINIVGYSVQQYGVPKDFSLLHIQPNRIVEKKVNGEWEVYNLDYYTPGVYRYKYIFEIQKGSDLYFMLRDDDNDLFNKTGVYINTKFYYQISNNSNRISKILPLELDSAKGRKYLLISKEFTVEAQKTISKVYLKSSFDIHNVHVGDLMKRVTLSMDKIVLTDGTELQPDEAEPFIINSFKYYRPNLNQFQVSLFNFENGNRDYVMNTTELTAFSAGKFQFNYFIRPNYKIGKYRFLIKDTDDIYGEGTEFYVNNERYEIRPIIANEDLVADTRITSPIFEVKPTEKKSIGGSTGSSSGSSSSGGSSSGSGGSGGSSGGGSGSFKVSSSFSGQVLGVDRSLSGGQWIQDEKGWWYKRADGSYPKNSWGYEAYNGKSYWYYFLDSGYMATGWVDVNGSKYYLFPNSDGWKGRMLTGWQWIDGNCYYLDPQGQNEGALYRNTTTSDGYAVDVEGRWVVNGAVQHKK